MRPHDVVAPDHTPSTAPSPCRRRASGQRAATPPAAIGSRPARGTVRHPLGGLFLGPVSRAGTAVEVPASRGKLRRSRPGEQFRHPLGGLFFNPGFRVGAAEDMRAAENSGRSRSGNGSPPPRRAVPSGSAWISNSPPAVLGSHAPDQVPDSVTDIDRPAAVPIHRRAMMPRSCSSI